MNKTMLSVIPAMMFSAFAFAATEKTANVLDASGKSIGQVKISEDAKGMKLALEIKGAKPGVHGMHLHKVGKCEGPDFKSSGDHFNPNQKQHGKLNKQGPHLGDLPNVSVPKSGELKQEVVAEGVSLKADGANTIATAEGTALVLHASADDYKTDPSGNSGDRIYCAVLSEPKAAIK